MEQPESSKVEFSAYRDWLKSIDDRFHFAKTYADGNPHEYVSKEWGSISNDMFEAFVMFIREYGREEMFYGDPYTVLDVDGCKYWTMGNPLEQTRVLNRRSYDGYDIIGELKDMGEDPSDHVDTDEYEEGEYYHPAQKNPE